jgi:Holliday junction DNA helicase RuvB
MMKDGDMELLIEIAKFEASVDMEKEYRIGWSWRHVRIWPATLSRLFKDGYLDNVFRSNSFTGYKLSEKAKALVSADQEETPGEPQPASLVNIADDLFADIIGHEDIKQLLKATLLAEKPVHIMLTGPPALAKTLFLWDIEQTFGEQAIWLVGSATSKAGLWDLVAEKEPKILLIDEMDKMNAVDMAALLTLMEGGRLVRAKRGLSRPEQPGRHATLSRAHHNRHSLNFIKVCHSHGKAFPHRRRKRTNRHGADHDRIYLPNRRDKDIALLVHLEPVAHNR